MGKPHVCCELCAPLPTVHARVEAGMGAQFIQLTALTCQFKMLYLWPQTKKLRTFLYSEQWIDCTKFGCTEIGCIGGFNHWTVF